MSYLYSSFNRREYEVHKIVYDLIDMNSKVLDIGCATGYFGKELLKKYCEIYGLEKDIRSVILAKKYYKKILIADLEKSSNISLASQKFDYILLLDVIEHIVSRRQLIQKTKKWIKHTGMLILSTPNIAHISIRFRLLMGDFTYSDQGILDKTHVHFFTRKQLMNFLEENGFKSIQLIPSADFGQIPIFGKILRRIPKYFQFLITKINPDLLAPQFVAICRI